jgi:hypothetical protein
LKSAVDGFDGMNDPRVDFDGVVLVVVSELEVDDAIIP